jgi:hypothetical protein
MSAKARLLLLAACGSAAACESRVNLDVTANAGTRYSSVLVTVREVWLNETATAAPDDTTWLRFPLSAPKTLELVDADGAAMTALASELDVPPGTYRQIRLLLVDRAEPLTQSARDAGATSNDEVTYFDADGVETTVPLELADAAHGIGIETELEVPIAKEAALAALAAGSSTGSAASRFGGAAVIPSTLSGPASSGSPFGGAGVPGTTMPGAMIGTSTGFPVMDPTTGALLPGSTIGAPSLVPTVVANPAFPATGDGTAVSPEDTGTDTAPGTRVDLQERAVTVTSGVFFDAARDLAPFRFGDRAGFVLSPSLTAFDLDRVGHITARLDVSSIAVDSATGRPEVEVTAEVLDEDANRRVAIASAPVRADGTFSLYPLPVDEDGDDDTRYDLVVHGPAVTTVVLRGVPATEGPPGDDADVTFGTITLTAAESYLVNLAAGSAVAPRGARVQFYQTLADDDAPFVIEEFPVDPLTGRFAEDQPLSASTVIVYGTFGDTFSLVAAAPAEGAAVYSAAAFSPLYGRGEFADARVERPAAGATAPITVPEIPPPSAAIAGTISASVAATTPGKYDNGTLLVTRDGAVVTAAPLSAILAGSEPSPVVTIPNVASGTERGLYRLEAWAWSSASPETSFTRQPVEAAVDLRSTASADAVVTVN